jgi:phage shock protein A
VRSPDYYRMLSDEELLLHGKEATIYSDEFVVALIERFEDMVELAASAVYREDTLQDRVEDLDGQIEDLECRVADLEQEVVAMAAQIKEQET